MTLMRVRCGAGHSRGKKWGQTTFSVELENVV